MKLPVNDHLTDIKGAKISTAPEHEGDEPGFLTLATVIQNSALNNLKGDEGLDGARKLALYTIASKTLDPDADYSVEEVGKIKDRIGRAFGPAIVGPAWVLIEAAGS